MRLVSLAGVKRDQPAEAALARRVCRVAGLSRFVQLDTVGQSRRSPPLRSHNACSTAANRLGFLEAVADAIQSFDGFKVVIDLLEFLAQALDVAVDCAVVDIDLIVIGRVH